MEQLLIIGVILLAATFIPKIKIYEIEIPEIPRKYKYVVGPIGAICVITAVFFLIREQLLTVSPVSPPLTMNISTATAQIITQTPISTSTTVVEEDREENPTVDFLTEEPPTIPAVSQDSPPAVGDYEAAFIKRIAPGLWPTGFHSYIIEFACTTDIAKPIYGNNGYPVLFSVQDLNIFESTQAFFLRYDAVYDAMTYGNKIDTVNQVSPSFATVVITRHTFEEAQRVLDECNAFISIDGLQKVKLDRNENPVLSVQEISLEDFPLLNEYP